MARSLMEEQEASIKTWQCYWRFFHVGSNISFKRNLLIVLNTLPCYSRSGLCNRPSWGCLEFGTAGCISLSIRQHHSGPEPGYPRPPAPPGGRSEATDSCPGIWTAKHSCDEAESQLHYDPTQVKSGHFGNGEIPSFNFRMLKVFLRHLPKPLDRSVGLYFGSMRRTSPRTDPGLNR